MFHVPNSLEESRRSSRTKSIRFLAQDNARKQWDEYPKAAETVLKSTTSELYQQLDDLWKLAGVQGNVRKWIPNSSAETSKMTGLPSSSQRTHKMVL